MKWVVIVLGGIIVLGLLGSLGTNSQNEDWGTYADIFAKRAVKAQLKDPDSAEFGEVSTFRDADDDVRWVCGIVNAKNSFGGYVGATPFVVRVTVTDRHPPNGGLRARSAAFVGDAALQIHQQHCRNFVATAQNPIATVRPKWLPQLRLA